MIHKRTAAESPSSESGVETRNGENIPLNQGLDPNSGAARIYANLAANPYFRRSREAVGAFPQALTLRISRERGDLVERIKHYCSQQLPKGSAFFEDHSNSQTFHLLIFLKDKTALQDLLEQPLRGEQLFNNTDGTVLNATTLMDKAGRLDGGT